MRLPSKVNAQTPDQPAFPRMADYRTESDTGSFRSVMDIHCKGLFIILGTVAVLTLGAIGGAVGYAGYQKFFGQAGKSVQQTQPAVAAPGR